jgi:hypothetical protein
MAARAFMDIAAANQFDVIDNLLDDDDPVVEFEFLTTPGDHNFPVDVVLSGSAYIASLNWDAPASGKSTYTTDFTGHGPMTKVEIPVVATP